MSLLHSEIFTTVTSEALFNIVVSELLLQTIHHFLHSHFWALNHIPFFLKLYLFSMNSPNNSSIKNFLQLQVIFLSWVVPSLLSKSTYLLHLCLLKCDLWILASIGDLSEMQMVGHQSRPSESNTH
jgi:hypothetical protein